MNRPNARFGRLPCLMDWTTNDNATPFARRDLDGRPEPEVSGTALAAGIVDGNELVASAIPLTFSSNELRYTIDLSSVPRLCHPCYRNDDRAARIAGAEHG
jgi:hypothetical protein